MYTQAVGCQDGSIACYNLLFTTVHGLYKDRQVANHAQMYIHSLGTIYIHAFPEHVCI